MAQASIKVGVIAEATGQHQVRMNTDIGRAKNGRFEIVESLGAIDPDEAMVPSAAEVGPGAIA
jgi:branched-chain amino acid transport system substrate-binding protein